MRRSLTDLIARADELADAFENHDPTPEDFHAALPPLMAVRLAAFRRRPQRRNSSKPSAPHARRTCPGANSARRSAPAARPPGNATQPPDRPSLFLFLPLTGR